jgi:hypothetical protein
MSKTKITCKLFRQIVLSRKQIKWFVQYGNYALKSSWRLSVAWIQNINDGVSLAGLNLSFYPNTESDPQKSNICLGQHN